MSEPRAREARTCGDRGTRAALSLPVLPPDTPVRQPPMRASRNGWKRAIVLALVHVVFIVHLAQWFYSGMSTGVRRTLSPIEPSESMYTLEAGQVNAGFILFAGAILSTLIFGRFFCGWACHVVAMQDLCSWFMTKLGVRPRPFRTRLLVFMPMVLGVYMFVLPTFVREVGKPGHRWAAEWILSRLPGLELWTEPVRRIVIDQGWREFCLRTFDLIVDPGPRPVLTNHIIVEDFWRTFAPWQIGVPFLLLCGFATVYFLGSKAFCTYGCPYGGLFGPADYVSVGKIVVNDNCEHCGHCTATCTSNVRVHEEVRDFGKVVDPGCMKCLDCVSVCPNDALAFKFAAPTVLTKARDAGARRRRAARPVMSDLTWPEEFWVGAILVWGTFVGYRGMLGQVPLLMSAGLGSIAAYLAFKFVSTIRLPNVRMGRLQLRDHGRIRRAGWVVLVATPLLLGVGAWSSVVRVARYWAGVVEYDVRTPFDEVFSPGYAPTPQDKARADRALRSFVLSAPTRDGGIGWSLTIADMSRVAWLHAVAGRLPEAEAWQRRIIDERRSRIDDTDIAGRKAEQREYLNNDVRNLALMRGIQGDDQDKVAAMVRSFAEAQPGMGRLWLSLAMREFQAGREAAGIDLLTRAVEADRVPGMSAADVTASAGETLLRLGQPRRAIEMLEAGARRDPHAPHLWQMLGVAHGALGDHQKALDAFVHATERAPRNPLLWQLRAQALANLGRLDEAQAARTKAESLRSPAQR